MMEVQVYSDTPIYGASNRPATISSTSRHAELTNTTKPYQASRRVAEDDGLSSDPGIEIVRRVLFEAHG